MVNRRAAFRHLVGMFGAAPWLALTERALADPGVLDPINVFEFRELAKKKLDPLAWDYLDGGASDEVSLKDNREAFQRVIIRPRALVDTHKIDLSLELFGKKLDFPILLDPAGGKNCFFPKGEIEVTRGAAKAGALHITNGGIEGELEAGRGPRQWWHIVTNISDKAAMRSFAKRMEAQGCGAICFSVDIMHVSHREREIRNRLDRSWCESGLPKRDAQGRMPEPKNPWKTGIYPSRPTPTPTWESLQELCSATSLPVVMKGIMTAEDADRCIRFGAKGILVSNHGARQLDHVGGTLEALPEVVKAVRGRVPVLLDGGIRRGTDVLKALALGANAICIARPYLYGLACFGQAGVERVIELLRTELALDMALAGVPDLRSIDPSLVRIRGGSF